MDTIRPCFEHHDRSLANCLLDANFTHGQARQFLSEAATGLLESCRNNSLYQTLASLLSDSQYILQRKIDVESIARNAELDSDQVKAGLHAIAPVLLQAVAQEFSQESQDTVFPGIHTRLNR